MSAPTIVSLFLLTLILPACGEDPVQGRSAGPGEITGTVSMTKTGQGVADAVIALVREGAVVATTATDDQGEFSFERLARGRYDLHLIGLELTGLSPLHTRFEPLHQRVELTGEMAPLLFAAVGVVPARITGVVRCDGQVDTDAALRIVGGAVDTVVLTNGIGRYALTDLVAGHYTLAPIRSACISALDPRFVHLRVGQYAGEHFDG